MKIEAGKYYKTRDGRKVGPMRVLWGKDFDYNSGHERDDRKCAWWEASGKRGGVTEQDALDLIAEWTDTTDDTPKLWRDMTPEEKGALLLAHHEGKVIEAWHTDREQWLNVDPLWTEVNAYRVQPANPVVETVTLAGRVGVGSEWSFGTGEEWPFDSHRITFNLIDGKPDCDSIRMEAIV